MNMNSSKAYGTTNQIECQQIRMLLLLGNDKEEINMVEERIDTNKGTSH